MGLDIETDHIDDIPTMEQCAIVNDKGKFKCRTMDEVFDTLMDTADWASDDDTNCTVMAHNGGRYDWWFLTEVFAKFKRMGWEVSPAVRQNTLIFIRCVDHPEYYKDSNKKKHGKFVKMFTFCDSLLIMPQTSVKDLGKVIGLPKLEPPMGEDFREGWSLDFDFSYENEESWRYVTRDAEICYEINRKMIATGDTHVTASGNTFARFKEKFLRGYSKKDAKNHWNKMFPTLSQYSFPGMPKSMDFMLRPGYSGGINYSDRGHYIGMIKHIDINSMYPTQMIKRFMPYGLPKYSTTRPMAALWMVRAEFKFHLKNKMIQVYKFKYAADAAIENIKASEPVKDTKHWHTLVMTNVDLETYRMYYDIEMINVQWYVSFKSKKGIFDDYVLELYDKKTAIKKAKEEGQDVDEFEYAVVKVMLNALYGRFGMNSETELWQIDDEEQLICVDECVENENISAYLPIAIFICAYARQELLTTCKRLIDVGCHIIHMDTDSIVYQYQYDGQDNDCFESDTFELGKWDVEGKPLEIYEGGPKRYIEILKKLDTYDGSPKIKKWMNVKCAGAPMNKAIGSNLEFLDDPSLIMNDGYVMGQEHYECKTEFGRKAAELIARIAKGKDPYDTRKIIRKKVKGGVLLMPGTWTLKDEMVRRA